MRPRPSRCFSQALNLLEKARSRSPRDEQIRREMVQTLASHAEFLGRLGKLEESLRRLLTSFARSDWLSRLATPGACLAHSRARDSTRYVSTPTSGS